MSTTATQTSASTVAHYPATQRNTDADSPAFFYQSNQMSHHPISKLDAEGIRELIEEIRF